MSDRRLLTSCFIKSAACSIVTFGRPMTSFGWKSKRKQLDKEGNKHHAFDDGEQIDSSAVDDNVDWLNNIPIKKHRVALEDSVAKAARLKEEGMVLASAERFREAIGKWDEALQLNKDDERILDMKAQALTELQELYPAVQTAESAVAANPLWWESRQTLGRAQLNLGEIRAAIVSFQKAIHVRPDVTEMWTDDLEWSVNLWKKLTAEKDVSGEELSFHVRECMRVGITS